MPVRFACPVCRAVMKAPSVRVGRKGNCPKCGQRLEIPPPPPQGTTILAKPLPPKGQKTPPAPSPSPIPPLVRTPFESLDDVEVVGEPIYEPNPDVPTFDVPLVRGSFVVTFGIMIVMVGVLVTGFFAALYDTSAPEFPGRPDLARWRLRSIDREQNRIIGIIVGIALAGAGLMMALFGRGKPR